MTVSQHGQYQDPETETAKWNPAIIHFVIYTSVLFCFGMSECQYAASVLIALTFEGHEKQSIMVEP